MAVPPDYEKYRRAWWTQGFGAWMHEPTPFYYPGVAWPGEQLGFVPPSPEVSDSEGEAES